ncbi:MAG: hypothetical protein ACREBI_11175 [Nitrosotalea sp.]
MKTLHLAIIVIFAIIVLVESSSQSNAFAQQNNSTIRYTPLHGSKMEITLDQGQSTTLPVEVSVPPGDKIINLLISLSPWPDGIYGTVSPQEIQNALTANMTLQIYVQPYVKPGNYTLDIVAQGWVNDTSGNAFMVNSETPIPLPVIVQTHTGTLSVSLGKMTNIKRESYCYNNGCSAFTSFEKFQLLLKSDVNSTVSLNWLDVPAEKWIHFDPIKVNVECQR